MYIIITRQNETYPKKLKEILGDEIKLYRKNKGITKEVHEGRRCWRLEYADGAQFHMDIVPSIPNGQEQRRLLETHNLNAQFADTAVAITDNEVLPEYWEITNKWPRSNPRGYAKWFEFRMGSAFIRQRAQILNEMLAEGVKASIEDIPTYRVRTPLQSAIMILKRHRDTMFAKNPTDKPISIIISTLAAHNYNGEETIGSALLSILNHMTDEIKHDGQKYIIRNPTDALENFADKWEEHPQRAEAFFSWLNQAREDFEYVGRLVEHRLMSNVLESRMGRHITEEASNNALLSSLSGNAGLLGVATSASAVAAPKVSFANEPRTPKKPDGFA